MALAKTLFLHTTGKTRTPPGRYFLLMSLRSLLAFLAWERALCCCPLHIYLLCLLAERKANGHCIHKYHRPTEAAAEFLSLAPSLTICNLKKSLSLARLPLKEVKANTLKNQSVFCGKGEENSELA
uniref:Uncharacterized protein n=1 Tax=Myotis myotis TaxID=51298 RepID=A0A7J7Z5N0_MYOMY|nr:hypothetical protein mMyoMyo1_010757 [Myotis myotis]